MQLTGTVVCLHAAPLVQLSVCAQVVHSAATYSFLQKNCSELQLNIKDCNAAGTDVSGYKTKTHFKYDILAAVLSPIHTADAAELDSCVASASAVCIGLK